jgi:FkbM family methyltransferase
MMITLVGEFATFSGYASMNEYLALGMQRAGARVNIAPHYLDVGSCSRELLELWARSSPYAGGPVLYASWMRPDLEQYTGPELFIRSMFEASGLPTGWSARLNRARAVIVPTTFVADAFRASGVTVPIAVVPDGVDPAVYRYEQRPERPGITTLIVAAVDSRFSGRPGIADRKHLPEAIAAWQLAFRDDPDARLILKCRRGRRSDFPDDPRITLVPGEERGRGIAHWYREADVLLALGNEGFGLPLIEGMATGLPVIALASEGQGDVCREAKDLVLAVEPARWEPHLHEGREACGVRGVPGVPDVAAKLRWVAEHRDGAVEIGRAASKWVHAHRDVWDYGPAVLNVIRGATPGRRRRRARSQRMAATDHDQPVAGDQAWQGRIVRLGNGLPIEVDPRDLVGGFIARHGYWEPETVAFLERWLRPGMTVVDAGAHVGQHAMVASGCLGPAGRVHAFEPNPELYEVLRRNLDRAGCANVEAHALALGRSHEARPFYLHPVDNLGASSLRASRRECRAVGVQVTTLDAYLAAHDVPRVDLLKVDVEGAERDLLAGAARTLEANPDVVVVMEFLRANARRFGHTLEDLERDLLAQGFRLFTLSQYGLTPYTRAGELAATVVAARQVGRLLAGLPERLAALLLMRLRDDARRRPAAPRSTRGA